ncbi:MAG: DNA replication/repair protein RecF [Pseudomonadota bacterium]
MSPAAAPAARVRRLTLTRFRSYPSAQVSFGTGPVVITGPNGAGKTNLLEAISFLSPGRGLRRARAEDVAQSGADGSWAVAAQIEGALGASLLGTGVDPRTGTPARKCRIDQQAVSSPAAFLDHLKVIWLTPEMDGLFLGPPSERRRFLDRLVLAVDGDHGARVNALERALRGRNRILEEQGDPRLLDALEHEVAELAVAVAAARLETVARLATQIAATRDDASPFPFAEMGLDGTIERWLADRPALEVEDRYRVLLRENRGRDRAAGRTLEGPHVCDLLVVHGPKQLSAARCSTGEQKSLLIGLTLSHARLVTAMHAFAPVVLLDDVAAYLDSDRRAGLFQALDHLGSQVFLTGADPAAFVSIDASDRVAVRPGEVSTQAA